MELKGKLLGLAASSHDLAMLTRCSMGGYARFDSTWAYHSSVFCNFSDKIMQISSKITSNCQNISKSYAKHTQIMSKSCPKHTLNISKSCPNHIRNTSKSYPNNFQTCPSRTHIMSCPCPKQPKPVQTTPVPKTCPKHSQNISNACNYKTLTKTTNMYDMCCVF